MSSDSIKSIMYLAIWRVSHTLSAPIAPIPNSNSV